MRWILLWVALASPVLVHADTYAIRGALVTPDAVLDPGILVVANGEIQSIGKEADVQSPSGIAVIDIDGFVYPGLIDLHNHVNWNAHPVWQLPGGKTFANRYEWQALTEYKNQLSDPHYAAMKLVGCQMQQYGEIKAIIGGVTSVAGGHTEDCRSGLVRNLDVGYEMGHDPVQYRIFPFELSPIEEHSVRDALSRRIPVVAHLAEGIDASAQREFSMLKKHEFLKEGFVIVHGVALTKADLADVATARVGLVWSPRSNMSLYGRTTEIKSIDLEKVPVALAPDWAPSGSYGMLEEVAFASQWNKNNSGPFKPADILRMTSIKPAKMAKASGYVGQLARGLKADFLVVPRSLAKDPYDAFVASTSERLLLVVIGGRPVYGDMNLMRQVNPLGRFESVRVCGVDKAVDTAMPDGSMPQLSELTKSLTEAFHKVSTELKLKTPMVLGKLTMCDEIKSGVLAGRKSR